MPYSPPHILFEASGESRASAPRIASTPGQRIRVAAVDDHFAVRTALIDTIQAQQDMELSGVAATAEEAAEIVERARPDVAVVDINLGDVSGIDLIERLRSLHPGLKVVVFSIFDESAYGKRAQRAGARGYVTKSESTQRVIEAIRVVASGASFFSRRGRGVRPARAGSEPATGNTAAAPGNNPADE